MAISMLPKQLIRKVDLGDITQGVTTVSPLALKDYTLIIDKSGSMSTKDMNGLTRWQAAAETTEALARKVGLYDPDGIDVWLFANTHKFYPHVDAEKVKQIFQENEPCGGTAMAEVLDAAITNFLSHRSQGTAKPNGEMIMVITDGEPNSKAKVKEVLTRTTHQLRPQDKLTISFLQVGRDPAASCFLKELDDDLQKQGAWRDIVEVIKLEDMENVGFTQFLLDHLEKTTRPQPT